MKRFIFASAIALTLAACAPAPGSIAPVSMPGAFEGVSCARALSILSDERAALASLEGQQNTALAGDSIGVMIIGLPLSSMMGGDVSGEIAATKGKIEALEQRLLSCR